MVVGGVRRRLRRRGTNHRSRRLRLPFSTQQWRQVARRILENDSDRSLDDELEDQSLELMVSTAPFSQIRANPMAWTLFMRGYEVGRHIMQMTTGDLQQSHEHDLRSHQSAAQWQNQMPEDSTPSVVSDVERVLVMEAASTPSDVVMVEESVEAIVTLPIDASLLPWLDEALSLMNEPQSMPTDSEQAHVPSEVEDLTSSD